MTESRIEKLKAIKYGGQVKHNADDWCAMNLRLPKVLFELLDEAAVEAQMSRSELVFQVLKSSVIFDAQLSAPDVSFKESVIDSFGGVMEDVLTKLLTEQQKKAASQGKKSRK